MNTLYEYKVVRTAPGQTAYGYVASGVNVPADQAMGDANHYRGKMVLVIAPGLNTALLPELNTLRTDLRADGWLLVEHLLNGAETVPQVRNLIIGSYNADQTGVKAVYLIGQVPVPYSGNMAPDGHAHPDDGPVHLGAWPCDGYYGEMNGTWPDSNDDTDLNPYPPAEGRNENTPGDGNFDLENFPGSVELQVGRLDMSQVLNAFGYYAELNEVQLLRGYLNKAHDFKIKAYTPDNKGVVFNNFNDAGDAYAFASNGYRNIGALTGYTSPSYTDLIPNSGASNSCQAGPHTFATNFTGNNYLWSYSCGGGQAICAKDVCSTDELADGVSWNSVFNMCFGSYFGDWDNFNDFLIAPLATGTALTNVWAGRPYWYFHTMGMGEPIGVCAQMTMNNAGASTTTGYLPVSNGNTDMVHAALMGDPSLRMIMVAPPSNLSVANVGGNASFTWTASSETVDGYYVYKFVNGVPTLLNATPVTGTSYPSNAAYVCGTEYMVRAEKLQVSATGTYKNLSLGALSGGLGGPVLVSSKVLLQGPFNGSVMTDGLRLAGLVPLTEPYTAMSFPQVSGGGCESTTAAVLSVTGANAVVDWVRVELRSSAASGLIVATRQGLLQSDGDVVSSDGSSALSFNVPSGNYYVAVRHRNHLGIMTLSSVPLSSTTTTLNFSVTTGGISTHGTNAQQTIGSRRVMWAGNTKLNSPTNFLSYTGTNNDRDPILVRVGNTTPNNTVVGYYMEDVTMNGTVAYTGAGNDRDPILVNVGPTTPNNTRSEQLP